LSSTNSVKVLFASGSDDLIPRAIETMREIMPELPLVIVSEFQPSGAREWIPFHIRRSLKENLALVRARLRGREVRLSAVILEPKTPYAKLRLMGFLIAPARLLALNENLDHFMLRPGSAGTLVRHLRWRLRNFVHVQAHPGGLAYTWAWRLRHPSALRRPLLYRAALFSGWLTAALKAGSPVALPPALPAVKPEGVSVVVPSRNGLSLLASMLPPVLAQLNPDRSEIIVVDNGSEDGTAAALQSRYPGVVVVHSDIPLSFARAVNRGIARARFSHLCLLNNDMIVEPGFFAALRNAFARVPDLFCATAQIFLPPDQRREETGKAAFPLERPREGFPVRCETPVEGENDTYVLYGSGGCSLYDTAKLAALGDVGEMFEPAYVEDLDLGFRAWRLNWPSVYVSGARVLHNHRTTTTRYYSEAELTFVLERNYLHFLVRAIRDRHLFRQLWREAVSRINLAALKEPVYTDVLQATLTAPGWIEPLPPSALPESEILALGSGDIAVFPGKPKSPNPVVLIASPYVPFPLSHGGAVRMYNLMRRAAREFDQVLVCFTDQLQPVPREVLDICVEVVYVRRATTHALPSTERPDVVEEFDSPVFRAALHQTIRKWKPAVAQLEFTQMAQYAADCAPAKTVLVEHDVTLDLYAQLLQQSPDWETRRQYEKWVRFENGAWGRVDRIVTMSEKDRTAVGRAHAVALPNGVDLQRFRPGSAQPDRARILFIGSFAHLPNLLALDFFLRESWPLLEPLKPVLHVIAGSRPEYFVERYKDRVQVNLNRPGLEVEGFVSDVRPAYGRATVVIAPLLASAGTNIKIMEAMAMGKAIVSTPAGINGLHELEAGRDVIVVQTGEDMACAIAAFFEDADTRRRLERNARETAVRHFDWDVIAAAQTAMYRGLLPLS
jgi:GT2 family glycosyltransferase